MKNETIQTKQLPDDIQLMCIQVPDFPNGIKEAFDELAAKFGIIDRTYYGVSWMEGERIIYMAAVATSFPGEENEYSYKPFTILKGAYLAKTLHNWMQHIEQIKETFMQLMTHEDFDFTYPCVEWYQSDTEMECWGRVRTGE